MSLGPHLFFQCGFDLDWGLDLCRFPFFVLRHEVSLGPRTINPILRIVAWSFNEAYLNPAGFDLGSPGPRANVNAVPIPIISQSSSSPWLARPAQVAFGGVWPSTDVNGHRLTDPKAVRRAGTPMADKWAVTEYRGDWTLGPQAICDIFFIW